MQALCKKVSIHMYFVKVYTIFLYVCILFLTFVASIKR